MVGIKVEKFRRDGFLLLGKLLRTKNPARFQDDGSDGGGPTKTKLKKVLTTLDLTSLGVGSCAGTGMYLVAGMVAKNIAGPGVILSFIIAAVASIFSGVCYAEFGVRVPNTSGGAYMYSYVTVGEFMAFVIGWNMVLEELIGTSACACALSACFDALANGGVTNATASAFGTFYDRPPDLLAFFLTMMMGAVLIAGVQKSVLFNNALNAINLALWVFIMVAGSFYVKTSNWSDHGGFMPYGWSGVLTGAATCFYAFIGFDIIATTGEEAVDARRSIPHAIVISLVIILVAYVTSSAIITLMVPFDQIDEEAALVEVFGAVGAIKCKTIVAVGALAGLTVSMFGTMFSLPRIVYAMAKDGLIFKALARVWNVTETPAFATIVFGLGAAIAAMFISLHVLVEMMSIGTLLAYSLVSTCVLILRYQPHSSTLIELLPDSIRTPMGGTPLPGSPTRTMGGKDTSSVLATKDLGVTAQNLSVALQHQNASRISPLGLQMDQKITIKRVTQQSLDSDDSGQTEEGSAESSKREDDYMMSDRMENKFYGAVPTTSRVTHWYDRYVELMYRSAPALFPWVDPGPCTEDSGKYVMKLVGLLYLAIITLDLVLVFSIGELEGHSPVASFVCLLLFISIICLNLLISRQPQNRKALPFLAPGLPWIPSTAVLINIYLILKLSILTLIRFVVWMTIGLFIYFYYGIRESCVDDDISDEIELHIKPGLLVTSNPFQNPTQTVPLPVKQAVLFNGASIPNGTHGAVSVNSGHSTRASSPPTSLTSSEGRNDNTYISPNIKNPFRTN